MIPANRGGEGDTKKRGDGRQKKPSAVKKKALEFPAMQKLCALIRRSGEEWEGAVWSQSLLTVRLDIATFLSVSGRFEVGRDMWQTLFHRMQQVKTLELKGRMSYALVEALNHFTVVSLSGDQDDESATSSTSTALRQCAPNSRNFYRRERRCLTPKTIILEDCHATDPQLQQLVAAGGVHVACSGQPYTWGAEGMGLFGEEDE
ncbi:uncharacterized protein STEHIDRAFT_108981 [Stereum hirsutum FP-91666 SS1]|uniref:uncharacterized protein n=1 Tax=Stereum hirsutum (strain FP-91666) TaxID=721885 RepID=UPI000440BB82|nr:uncharacterized protein STEHIDRAFT_108981 [Stereum hirsutum FP-91666 SS1]EIM90502.1 hypothetical protein STEHIDRAFT_108981 [Stereum hirsutum FP-91666 SS1]